MLGDESHIETGATASSILSICPAKFLNDLLVLLCVINVGLGDSSLLQRYLELVVVKVGLDDPDCLQIYRAIDLTSLLLH